LTRVVNNTEIAANTATGKNINAVKFKKLSPKKVLKNFQQKRIDKSAVFFFCSSSNRTAKNQPLKNPSKSRSCT